MGATYTILVVDDVPANVKLLADVLAHNGYRVVTATNGVEALERVSTDKPDLVLLDIVMPELSGYDVCRALRADPVHAMLPVVLITSLDPHEERIHGIEAGADDFLSKPVSQPELLARVKSLLRVKTLYDTVQRQANELRAWTETLQVRVAEKVQEVEHLNRLKRFLPPPIVQAVTTPDGGEMLASHRREIVVVYLDMRGFTAFSEQAAPEEVMEALSDYHAAMGQRVIESGGTLERFTGDAIMVFLNDPVPIDNAALRGCEMALAMRDDAVAIAEKWKKRGFAIGVGFGISQGYATLGTIGFEARRDYAAIGPVTNLAARLCADARASEILMSQRVFAEVETHCHCEPVGLVQPKGFSREVSVYRLLGLRGKNSMQPTSAGEVKP